MNKQNLALSISVGLLAGISLILATVFNDYIVWVGFVFWSLFYKNGGNNTAFKNSNLLEFMELVIAGLFFILSELINIGGLLNQPIWISITIFILIFGTQIPIFSCAPTAVFCSYAVTVGYCLVAVDGAMIPMISTVDITNPLVSIIMSIVIGSIFGIFSKVAKAISS